MSIFRTQFFKFFRHLKAFGAFPVCVSGQKLWAYKVTVQAHTKKSTLTESVEINELVMVVQKVIVSNYAKIRYSSQKVKLVRLFLFATHRLFMMKISDTLFSNSTMQDRVKRTNEYTHKYTHKYPHTHTHTHTRTG